MATPDSVSKSRPDWRDWRSALLFAAIAAALAAFLVGFAAANRVRIELNEQAWLAERLRTVLNGIAFDNEPLTDAVFVTSPDRLGSAARVPVYRARRNGQVVAVVFASEAPEGYGGSIRLLVAISSAGAVLGVSVLDHRETPGLGDAFALAGSSWLDAFKGRAVDDPPVGRWNLRAEGGEFDAFTGASITPRAIVKAVYRTLEYYSVNRERLHADQ